MDLILNGSILGKKVNSDMNIGYEILAYNCVSIIGARLTFDIKRLISKNKSSLTSIDDTNNVDKTTKQGCPCALSVHVKCFLLSGILQLFVP